MQNNALNLKKQVIVLLDYLAAWYQTSLGRAVLQAELEGVRAGLERHFGFYALQIGCPAQKEWLASSRASHKVYLHPELHLEASVQGLPFELPFASDSIDTVILPHLLEFYGNPRAILEEILRILAPEGRLIILGFNPMSVFGLRRWLSYGWSSSIWQARFKSQRRVKRWLKDIGFTLLPCTSFFYPLPLQNEKLLLRSAKIEKWGRRLAPGLGSVYLVAAEKRVVGLTPLRSSVLPLRARLGGAAPCGRPN